VLTTSAIRAGSPQPGNEEDELVAAQSKDARSAADDGEPAVGDLLEQSVSAGVAHRVVELLEAVEIEQGDRHRVRGAFPAGLEEFLQGAVERGAVRQTGQRIAIGELGQPFAHGLGGGGVAHDGEHAAVVERAQHDVDGKLAAVLTASEKLEATAHRANGRAIVNRCAVADVTLANPFGEENFDRLADQLGLLVSEQGGELAVDLPYDAVEIRGDDRIGNEIERNRSFWHCRLCAAGCKRPGSAIAR
jgi:hypothetical protein